MLVQLFETIVTDPEAGVVADVLVVPPWAFDLRASDDSEHFLGVEHSIVAAMIDVLGLGLSARASSAAELSTAIAAVLAARSAHEAGDRFRSDPTADLDDATRRACVELAFAPIVPIEQSPLEKVALAALAVKGGVVLGVGGPALAAATGPMAPVVLVAGAFGAVILTVGRHLAAGFTDELKSDADALGRRGYTATREYVLDKLGLTSGESGPVGPRQPRNASISDINDFLQRQLAAHDLDSVAAVEAARWLDEAGLLPDDPARSGVRLRYLLRTGQIEGGEQIPRSSYGRWYVYRI